MTAVDYDELPPSFRPDWDPDDGYDEGPGVPPGGVARLVRAHAEETAAAARQGTADTPSAAAPPRPGKVAQPKGVPGFEDLRATNMAAAVEPMMARFELFAEYPDAAFEPTGIDELDQIVSVMANRLYIVAGRQGAGKSALMLQVARYMAHRGPVLYLLTEMSLEEVVERIVASSAHVPLWKLQRIRKQFLPKIREVLEWLAAESNLTIVEAQGEPLTKLAGRARRFRQANGELRALFIDNLWGLSFAEKALGSSTGMVSIAMGKVAEQAYKLSLTAGGLDCPVFLAHHLNRDGAGANGAPKPENLGGSDHVGNWASTVIALAQATGAALPNGAMADQPFDEDAPQVVTAHVVKNRGGRLATLDLLFHGAEQRFEGKPGSIRPLDTPPAETSRDREFRERYKALPDFSDAF